MAIGAGLHEAHRHDAMGLAIRIDVLAFVEAGALHQRPAAVGLAIKDLRSVQLGHKPVGELGAADAARAALAAGAHIVDGRFAQAQGTHIEALAQLGDQPWFIDLLGRLIRAVHPEVEAADHHRTIGQIHHGAWSIGGDQLAVAHFPLGAHGRLTSHQFILLIAIGALPDQSSAGFHIAQAPVGQKLLLHRLELLEIGVQRGMEQGTPLHPLHGRTAAGRHCHGRCGSTCRAGSSPAGGLQPRCVR